MSDRYVILGLASARAAWFATVSRWSTAGVLPAEFLKCQSTEELRARFGSGRPFSAVILDGGLPRVDRDLVSEARRAGCAVFVVDDAGRRDWLQLGAHAVLPSQLGRDELLAALTTHATALGRADQRPVTPPFQPRRGDGRRGDLVTVCGPGGTGASTVAAALAQGLAAVPSSATGGVLLADLCRHAQQALLHDAGDVVPGLEELVDLHRGREPTASDVRALTFDVSDRGYHLLLGLRRPTRWPNIRPHAFGEALESLRRAFGTVVCDVTGDFEGEDDTGSVDVDERNVMAREAARASDVVFVVGTAGVKGTHSLVTLVADVLSLGVAAPRVVPVVNGVPRLRRRGHETAAALTAALRTRGTPPVADTVVLPHRPVDAAVRAVAPVPRPLPGLVANACAEVLRIEGRRGPIAARQPELVTPGSVGSWTE